MRKGSCKELMFFMDGKWGGEGLENQSNAKQGKREEGRGGERGVVELFRPRVRSRNEEVVYVRRVES